jgi:hypothetical protein
MEFFMERHGVSADDLPGRLYSSESPGTPPTKRYSVDRGSILIGASGLTFVYVSGWNPVGVFAAFLNAYAPLLRRLQHTRVLFCTPDEGVVPRARRMCERRFGTPPTSPVDSGHTERVLAHFGARRRYEQRQFRTFTATNLSQLRADLDRFAGPVYEDWYERWCMAGADAAPPVDLDKLSALSGKFGIPEEKKEKDKEQPKKKASTESSDEEG